MRLICLALLLNFCLRAEQPSAESLIRRAIAADQALTPLRNQYVYTEQNRNQQIGKDGKRGEVTNKTYDVIFLEGEPYRKLILLEGKPLPLQIQKKVDEEYNKTRAERRARRAGLLHIERNVTSGGLSDFLTYFDNRVSGLENVNGHAAWLVVSTPKTDLKPQGKQQAEILGWSHKSWFDEKDGARIRSEETLLRAVNGLQPGWHDLEEYDTGAENCWLLRRSTTTGTLAIYKMIHGSFETVQTYTNYRRFDVTSTITAGEEVH